MMGLGSFSNGGSSSSSNLSASAPPFMVDQSISKPNSNPLVNFSESLYGSGAFISSLPSWVPSLSPSSRPDFYANPTQEIDSIPSPKFDRYLVPPAVNSPNAPMSPLNSVTMDATGGFSFGQFKDSLKMGVVEAKPYYPSYVSSALHEDNPLVALNEPAYDFLSTSHVAPLTGTSQGDYSQSLSKLESSTRWDGSWNASIDLESGGQTDSHWSFFTKLANSPIYKDYDVPGAGASKVLSSFEESSAVSRSMNELGRENQVGSLGVTQLDVKSFASKDYKFIPFKSSTSGSSVLGSGSGSSLLSPKIHSCATSIDSIANSNSLSSQKLDNVEYEKCFRQRDMRLDNFSPVSKSSAVVGNRLPSVEVSSSALNTISFENVNYIATAVAGKSEDSACNSLSNVNDHHLTLSFEGKEACANPSRLGLFPESYNYHVADAFSTTKEELSSNKFVTTNAFDHLSKPTSKLQFGQTRNPDGFGLVFDDTKAADSAENPSKTIDQYNPAEDSPCWKGASASRFFPFEVPEAHTPQHLMENSEPSNILSLEPQIYPLNSDDLISVKFSKSTEYNENGPSRNGLSSSVVTPSVATYSYGEQGSDNSLKSPEQSSDGVQLPNSFYKDRKENTLMENSTIDADNRHSLTNITAPSPRKVKFPSERKCGPGTCAGDTGMIINDASEYGSSHAPIHNTKEISFSDTVEDTPTQRVKPRNEVSTSKIDVQMLIKTMQNLSNLLLFYGSNDVCGLSEEDNETLKNVIKNLEAYMFKNEEQMAPRRESEFPQQGTSHFLKESPKLHEGARVDRANATKVAVADAIDELGHQLVPKDNKHNIVPRKKDEIFQDLIFARNDVETVKTDSMTQAIKKLLSENFHDGGELEPEASLYKNLWLEAEAAICSMSYRARYNRTKIEMDKFKHKEAEESSINEEKLSKSRVYPDLTTVNKLASESKYGVQGSHIISSTGHSDAVLTRFHILKYRVDNSPSMNAADSEKLSCNVSPDLNMAEKLETHANDSLTSDTAAMGSPISSKSTYTDEIEDSVMARFRILKRRFDNSSSTDMGGQQLPEVADLGFVGRRNLPSTTECIQDGTFNFSIGHQLQHHSEDCTEEESKLCEGGDMIIQSCGTDKLGNQLPAGWYDTSSFDWEHVVKDDFVPPK